jgi:hypothetical protein
MNDNLGVTFEVGDRVTVVGYGYGVRLADTGRTGIVTGFTRGRVRLDTVNALGDPIARGKAVHPSCILVARRDGAPGHQGNVR